MTFTSSLIGLNWGDSSSYKAAVKNTSYRLVSRSEVINPLLHAFIVSVSILSSLCKFPFLFYIE